MAEVGRSILLREVFRPKLVRYGGGFVAVVAAWDAFFNQFELPKIGSLVGMSGALLPWWGWLLILQALFVYGLFEYVRRNVSTPQDGSPTGASVDELATLEKRFTEALKNLGHTLRIMGDRIDMIVARDTEITQHLDAVESGGRDYAKGLYDALLVQIATEAGERAGLSETASKRLDEHRSILAGHDEALLAIYHRERMLALAKHIDAKSLELGVPLAEGKVMSEEEWEAWKSERLQWESTVHDWAGWARFYLGRDPMEDIKRINSEGLDENWAAKADQFPDPEGLRIYKTFRIYLRNYASIRDVAYAKVRRKAFEGVGG